MNTIGFVGDIHCGSHYGLWPLEDLPESKAKFLGIRALMECWQKTIEGWPQLDLLCLMGDLIDGKQYKSQGTGVFTTDLGEQVEAAEKVLEPLIAKAKRVIRVWGTPYHEGFDSSLRALDNAYGIELVQQVIDIDLGSGVLNVAHHPSGGSSLYQGTKVDREALWSMLAAHEGKVLEARWIVRAHVHNYMLQETENRTMVLLPAWQLPTPHAKKQNYFKWQPTIGSVLMNQDDSHPSGYRFTPTLWPITPAKPVKLK